MKLLFVQLSDMHCKSSDIMLKYKIEKAITALSSLPPVDNAFLIFSGDLTNSAEPQEFKAGWTVIEYFLAKLKEKQGCSSIDTLIVPGNHDMVLSQTSRSAHIINQWDKFAHLDQELSRLSAFFECAKAKNCFKTDKMVDVVSVTCGDIDVQFYLINSAPYSTREKEDKQLHYLPAYVGETLSAPVSSNTLRIAICHHSYEWFDWNSREMLRTALTNSDIVFFGHDHQAETISISSSSGSNINAVMGGEFPLDCSSPCAFNALIFDTESLIAQQFQFDWDVPAQIFVSSDKGTIQCMQPSFSTSKSYLDSLLMNNEQPDANLLDYFVFPKLIPSGDIFSADNLDDIGADDLFSVLDTERIIKISGRSRAGKTSLIKFLYSESIARGYLPLLIEKKDYKDSRINKMLADMVERQYVYTGNHGYDIYEQEDHNRQIVFIDDIDSISSTKARGNLVDYILSSGRMVVYSTKDSMQDLEEVAKSRLQGKDTCSFEISPFYKESRDALIENVCVLRNKNQTEKTAVITALDYLVQSQASFFSLDPGSLLQYINFFLNGGTREGRGIETLSLVFETNLRNVLIAHLSGENIIAVLSALEYLSGHMYFSLRQESIESPVYEQIISDFCQRRKVSISAKTLFTICQNAHILQEETDSFKIKFSDKNTFAYFVAKHISSAYEKDPSDLTKLSYVMNHICFGINDTIVLFLAFIRSNTKVILEIATKALELLEPYPEWNFEENNIPFLVYHAKSKDDVPTQEESKAIKKQQEQTEKDRHELVKFGGIFDYSDDDANKRQFQIWTAFKYAQLIGRALVDQYGALDADEIELITQTLYTAPQKIIYALLTPYQIHYDDLVKSLVEFAQEKLPEEKVTTDEIKEVLAEAGTIQALNIMNDIAYNASSPSTILALRDITPTSINQKIMQLMMEENAGNTPEFISCAIALREELSAVPYAKTLIAQIARKHILYTPNIDYREIDKLVSGHIITPKGKKTFIIEQGSKAKE